MTNHRVSRQWIWKFIAFLYLIYLVEAMLLAVIGLVVSKVSRGNIEAFTIMSVVLVGKQLFALLMSYFVYYL